MEAGIREFKIFWSKIMKTIYFILILCLIAPVMGATTLNGVKLMGNYTTNETIIFPMKLSTSSSDPNITYQITVLGFGNNAAGSYIGIKPDQDISPYSARPYITLDKSEVTITPGKSEIVTATIKTPTSALGGLYALINIHPKITNSNGTTVVTAMNVPVMITITNNTLIRTGEITKIVIDPPNTVSTTFTNTGNIHYYNVRNIIGINNEYLSTNPLITAIIPGETVIFSQHMNKSLNTGTYIITSYIIAEDEFVIAVNKTTFDFTKLPVTTIPVTSLPTVKKSPVGIEIIIISIITVFYLMKTTSFKYR